MDAVQQSLNHLMLVFGERMDAFEGRQASRTSSPGTPGNSNLAVEFGAFKAFVLASLRAIQEQIELLAEQMDQQEMRSRRKILLLHGLREQNDENTPAVVVRTLIERIKVTDLKASDVTRCHRIGRTSDDTKPRPILFELRDDGIRNKIWSSKAGFKGSGITVTEFLTKARHSVFLAARQEFGVSKCWTGDGFIFVIGPDGTRHRISCAGELAAVGRRSNSMPRSPAKEVIKNITPMAAVTKTSALPPRARKPPKKFFV